MRDLNLKAPTTILTASLDTSVQAVQSPEPGSLVTAVPVIWQQSAFFAFWGRV